MMFDIIQWYACRLSLNKLSSHIIQLLYKRLEIIMLQKANKAQTADNDNIILCKHNAAFFSMRKLYFDDPRHPRE
jgi:hypothetical protein